MSERRPYFYNRFFRTLTSAVCGVLMFALLTVPTSAATKRVVVLKMDGLMPSTVEQFVALKNPRTGKSMLPWIEQVLYRNGTRVENFYVRGMSLSASSWSLLDTGAHLQIKGNVEYDRYTFKTHDYLNLFQYYLSNARGQHLDAPGTELLDELHVPLYHDAYEHRERYLSFQLFQRSVRWLTLGLSLPNHFRGRAIKDMVDEWTFGFDFRPVVLNQTENEITERIVNRHEFRYIDFYSPEFDHETHNNRDLATHLHAAQIVDRQLGNIWTAIQKSPFKDETALVLVSDHGTNTHPRIYSQSFNLVTLFGSPEGGGHHVVSKRRQLADFAIKGTLPLAPLIHSTSRHSRYLANQSSAYPTAMLDFDGNERAALHLRHNGLNKLHVLLQQLKSDKLSSVVRQAATHEFFNILNRYRPHWVEMIQQLRDELPALERQAAWRESYVAANMQVWTPQQREVGFDYAVRRRQAEARNLRDDLAGYGQVMNRLARLVELDASTFDARRVKIEDLIPPNYMGDANALSDLQNYVVGLAPRGLQLKSDDTLDVEKSFETINYFPLLTRQKVENNVQPGVGARPVDFVAVRLNDAARAQLTEVDKDFRCDEAVWLFDDDARQALILARTNERGKLELRYVPTKHLKQTADGKLFFLSGEMRPDLPLKLYEDARLNVADKQAWFGSWHTDEAWLAATHLTAYSNAVIGLHEQFARHPLPEFEADENLSEADARLLARFRTRQREAVETDLFLHAGMHWNFDMKNFNPGGNHGSFYRVSTHSVLMFAGGERTSIPRGLVVTEPYDSLDFVPTMLALTGDYTDGKLSPVVRTRGFRTLPGRIIKQVIGIHAPSSPLAATGAKTAP